MNMMKFLGRAVRLNNSLFDEVVLKLFPCGCARPCITFKPQVVYGHEAKAALSLFEATDPISLLAEATYYLTPFETHVSRVHCKVIAHHSIQSELSSLFVAFEVGGIHRDMGG